MKIGTLVKIWMHRGGEVINGEGFPYTVREQLGIIIERRGSTEWLVHCLSDGQQRVITQRWLENIA